MDMMLSDLCKYQVNYEWFVQVTIWPQLESLLPHGGSRVHKGAKNDSFTDGRCSVNL